jgi:hypothetical protein
MLYLWGQALDGRNDILPIHGGRRRRAVDNFRMKVPSVEKTLISKMSEVELRVGLSCIAKLQNTDIARVLESLNLMNRFR